MIDQNNVSQIYDNLQNNQPDIRQFSHFSFDRFNATMLENWINRLNDEFHWNINFPANTIDGRRRNAELKRNLYTALNQHRVRNILIAFGIDIPDTLPFGLIDRIVDCIKLLRTEHLHRIQQQLKRKIFNQIRQKYIQHKVRRDIQEQGDNDFFATFDREQYKQDVKYFNDSGIQQNHIDEIRRKFMQQIQQQSPRAKEEKEHRKQLRQIAIAKQALSKALELIKTKQNKIFEKLQQATPENQELYDYLNANKHSFTSKDAEYAQRIPLESLRTSSEALNGKADYLTVNEPYDRDAAIQAIRERERGYDKANHTDEEDKPIYVYYWNNIKSLEEIYDDVDCVYNKGLKPFKI